MILRFLNDKGVNIPSVWIVIENEYDYQKIFLYGSGSIRTVGYVNRTGVLISENC